MNKEIFIARYQKFDVEEKVLNECIETILTYEKFLDKDIDSTNILDIKRYVDHLLSTNKNTPNNLIHIARYYYYINKSDNYIYMTKYFNSIGVLENIVDRIAIYDSEETKKIITKDLNLPPFASDSKDIPLDEMEEKIFSFIKVENTVVDYLLNALAPATPGEIQSALLSLELKGLIRRLPGRVYTMNMK